MSVIGKLISQIVLNLVEKLAFLVIDFFKTRKEYKKIINDNLDQALLVDSLAKEIRDLIKAGKPVPIELEERLKDESKKLIDGSFDGGNVGDSDRL